MSATPISFDHWQLAPLFGPSSLQRERQREALRRWKAKRRAQGMCSYCGRRPAGSDGGTAAICGHCRRQRKAERNLLRAERDLLRVAQAPSSVPHSRGRLCHTAVSAEMVWPADKAETQAQAGKETRPRPPRPAGAGAMTSKESLAFKRKPPMHEGVAKIERMLYLSALAGKRQQVAISN